MAGHGRLLLDERERVSVIIFSQSAVLQSRHTSLWTWLILRVTSQPQLGKKPPVFPQLACPAGGTVPTSMSKCTYCQVKLLRKFKIRWCERKYIV